MTVELRRAVFLDRDGVLNEAIVRNGLPYPPRSLQEVRLMPGAEEGLARLKSAGFVLLVVTNQPDVVRGQTSLEEVNAINQHLASRLPLDDFFICPHDGAEKCHCRKPKPGLIEAGALKHRVDPRRSYMIGDRWRDVDAGHAAGCSTVFIDFEYRERAPDQEPSAIVRSLPEAVDWILADKERRSE